MGLDMYLSAEKFISGYDHAKDENFKKILDLMNLDESDVEKSAAVKVNVGYWRKANAIHNWFVQNVQKGEDNCGTYYVTQQKLLDLRIDAQAALDQINAGDPTAASNILPPTSGFFFGSTEVDEWYKRDLEKTIEIIDKCLGPKFKGYDLYYHSSW